MWRVAVAYTLTGSSFDPDSVTRLTGVIPSKTWRIGDLIQARGRARYQHNGWRLDSKLADSASVEDQVKHLLKRLRAAWREFVNQGVLYNAELSCVIRIYDDQIPAIHLDHESLREIAELNANVDVDVYTLLNQPVSKASQARLVRQGRFIVAVSEIDGETLTAETVEAIRRTLLDERGLPD